MNNGTTYVMQCGSGHKSLAWFGDGFPDALHKLQGKEALSFPCFKHKATEPCAKQAKPTMVYANPLGRAHPETDEDLLESL